MSFPPQHSSGAGERGRTADLSLTRRLLCHLSYTSIFAVLLFGRIFLHANNDRGIALLFSRSRPRGSEYDVIEGVVVDIVVTSSFSLPLCRDLGFRPPLATVVCYLNRAISSRAFRSAFFQFSTNCSGTGGGIRTRSLRGLSSPRLPVAPRQQISQNKKNCNYDIINGQS